MQRARKSIRLTVVLIAAATFAAAAPPPLPTPINTNAPPLGFTAAFPEKPKHEVAEKVIPYEGGADAHLQVHRYSVESDTGIFVVTWFDIPKELFDTAAAYAKTPQQREERRAQVVSSFIDD